MQAARAYFVIRLVVAQLRQNRHSTLPYVQGMHFRISNKRQHDGNGAHTAHFRLNVFYASNAAQEIETAHANRLVQLVHNEAQDAAGALLAQEELGLVGHEDGESG